MDQDLLKEVLNDHSKIDQISLFELDQWIDLYPFAQSLHFLKAKKLQQDKKVIDLQPFHRLACYTTDHSNLYDLMIEQDYDILPSDARKQELNEKLTELINDAKTSEKIQVINQETTVETDIETNIKSTIKQNIAKSQEIEEELDDSEEEIQITEREQMEPNESKIEIAPIEYDELIPEESPELDQSLLDISPKKKKKKKKKKAKTRKKDKKKNHKKASAQKERQTISKETDISSTRKIQTNSEQNQYDPFTEWLLSLKPTSTENTKHTSMAKDKNSKKKKDKKGKKSSKKKILKKLEKKLKKQKKKDKKDKKKSKKINKLQRKIDASLERRAEAVSPTLAAFMKKQGYYKESIKIYKQLKLIYPEKSSYFASEIKKLKKLC